MTKKRNRNTNYRSTQTTQPVSQEDSVSTELEKDEETVSEEQETNDIETPEEETHETVVETLEEEEVLEDEIEGVTSSPEVIEDTVTPKPVIVDPVVPTAVAAPQVEVVAEEVVEPSVGELSSDDSEHVSTLKIQLSALRTALNLPGKTPEDYKAAAKLSATITKYVIKQPRTEVLETLLKFFIENKDGVCAPTQYMKGSTTLSAKEEQQVGFLYNLFSDLANKRIVKINDPLVIQILTRPEIVAFYNKKVSGLKAVKK